MDQEKTVFGIMQELRRGTLILVVLSQLRIPMYGYDLVHRLSEGGFPIEANTLYPLLRRLESQGLLESRWETGEAKPRKYYNITPEGTAVLQEASAQWGILTDNVRTMMEVQEHE